MRNKEKKTQLMSRKIDEKWGGGLGFIFFRDGDGLDFLKEFFNLFFGM